MRFWKSVPAGSTDVDLGLHCSCKHRDKVSLTQHLDARLGRRPFSLRLAMIMLQNRGKWLLGKISGSTSSPAGDHREIACRWVSSLLYQFTAASEFNN